MKKIITILLTGLIMTVPTCTVFALNSEMHITKNGDASIHQAKVMQIAGNTFFARLYWGDAFIRFTIKTNSATKFLRGTDEVTTISEIKEGDILDVEGTLETGGNTLNLVATTIKNSSVQKGQATLSGTVTNIELAQRQFTLATKDYGVVTVKTAISTPFLKGTRTLSIGELHIGDTITKTSGDYDYTTKTLVTDKVIVYIDMSIFKAQNFAGKLIEAPIIADDGSATLKVMINKTTYTAMLPSNTVVMRASRKSATLQRFITGDSIRLYGVVREMDEPVIDVEVIRNMNL